METSRAYRAAPSTWPFVPAPGDEDDAARNARLAKDPGPIKSNWVPPNRSARYGRAEGRIDASYDAVRGMLLDYTHYSDLAGPKFAKVRVVGKEKGATDVYFNLPIMRGMVRLWYVTRFRAPRAAAGSEVFEGLFVKGNVDDMHIVFTLHHGDNDASTALTCDLLLKLRFPAPAASVDEELRDACGDAIHSIRRMAQKSAVAVRAP